MPFRLPKDAKKWFRAFESQFELDFDIYYLCLMAGLATGRKADLSSTDTAELVDDFPGVYRQRGRLMVALFLSRELRALGVDYSERKALDSAIHALVEPRSPSHLSDGGMKEMNRYANGGLEALQEEFGDSPKSFEAFIINYRGFIEEAAAR